MVMDHCWVRLPEGRGSLFGPLYVVPAAGFAGSSCLPHGGGAMACLRTEVAVPKMLEAMKLHEVYTMVQAR